MTVYVVVSDTIAYGQSCHGLHGVYQSIESAQQSAMSTIISTAQRYGYNIIADDIVVQDEDYLYENNKIDIVVSCIEQELS